MTTNKIICHEHCPSGPGAPIGLIILIILGAVAVTSRAAHQAASTALRVLTEVAVIAAIVAGSVVGLAVVAGLAVVTVRVRRTVRARAHAREVERGEPARVLTGQVVRPVQQLDAQSRTRAIEPVPAAWPVPWLVTRADDETANAGTRHERHA